MEVSNKKLMICIQARNCQLSLRIEKKNSVSNPNLFIIMYK